MKLENKVYVEYGVLDLKEILKEILIKHIGEK